MTMLEKGKDWFTSSRFGLFIHWGLYSLPARHEWVRTYEQMPQDEYDAKYFSRFDPDLFNPEEWAEAAFNAGMKYAVLTAKHHDGFCLWDSKLTDYTAVNTPAGRDLVKDFIEAFRAKGIKVGLYYSLLDWHHPDFVVDQHHPERSNLEELNRDRDQKRYIEYLHGQVKELLTFYGKVDIMWFDFSYKDEQFPKDFSRGKGPEAWESRRLVDMIRELQPDIVLNDRHGLPDEDSWDFKTPEQFLPRSWYKHDGRPVVWEACQTFSGSWGYYRDQHDWRSSRQILSTLIGCVAMGGNLIMNIGPTGRGKIDPRALDRMKSVSEWMKYHGRAIYGCTKAPDEFVVPENCMMTYNPERECLYLHILNWPYKHIHLDGEAFKERVLYAQLLHDSSEVLFYGLEEWQEHAALNAGFDNSKSVTLLLPQKEPDVEIPVIELFLKKQS